MNERTTPPAKVGRLSLLIAGNILVLIALVILIEGCASAVLFARDVAGTAPVAERLHTRYDAELGWVAEEDVERPDMYGPGVVLTTNSRGFRGRAEYSPTVTAGKVRIVCTGDSFTLGYGVSDEDTWCHGLTRLDARLETVNMGQGGYGFDQAYLWYVRDAADLEHQIQILAFITDDFRRMQHDAFLGYPKPMLALDGDSLRVTNVPVPRRGYGFSGWLTRNAEPLRSLRSVQFAERWIGRGGREATPVPGQASAEELAETRRVVAATLQRLTAMHAARGTELVLVHFPTTYELRGEGPLEWQAFLREEAAALGIHYIDLYPLFRGMDEEERRRQFLRAGDLEYPAAAGHFSVEGNRRVAHSLYDALGAAGSIPAAEVADR